MNTSNPERLAALKDSASPERAMIIDDMTQHFSLQWENQAKLSLEKR
jgi:hypothetical protein